MVLELACRITPRPMIGLPVQPHEIGGIGGREAGLGDVADRSCCRK